MTTCENAGVFVHIGQPDNGDGKLTKGEILKWLDLMGETWEEVCDGQNNTFVCHSENTINTDQIIYIKKALKEAFHFSKVVFTENNTIVKRLTSYGGTMTVHFIVGGQEISPWIYRGSVPKEEEEEDEASVKSECSTDFFDKFDDITGQGMTQQTDLLFGKTDAADEIPKPTAKPKKNAKKGTGLPSKGTRRSNRLAK
ncbi:hypothetical protein SEMRO_186_G080550.1 [Seminavis robusta]|uniref:Uncharacterized protein n=1 Tax=Seminavis robusta TaxID=568900 RepID=A0A9N8DJ43_9STRA|nr:hypothetical protein SEMRO_186_G080550.1 [Seminavis robusta]|eukprot:Sro186_g080550.1 n/a (198) ;mRNA; f:6013-6606